MTRLLLMLLILAELSAAALFALALRYGRFDQGVGFYLYLAGPLVALAIATGVALPVEPLRRVGTHGLLLLGCVLFALPFVWLVGTSFKYEEEIFVYPPQWLPATPGAVECSPYVAADAFPAIERPAAVDAQRWDTLQPALIDAIWRRSVELDAGGAAPMAPLDPAAVKHATTAGLWQLAAGGIADAVWQSGDDARIIAAVVDRIDLDAVKTVRDGFLRSVELGAVAFADDDGIEHRADGGWTPNENVAPPPTAAQNASAGPRRVSVPYDLSQSPRVELIGDFRLPIDPARLLSVRLPMRQDRSWNRLTLQLEAGGKRYALEDNLYLGNRRWQEFTFRLKHKDPRDERDIGIWPLVPAKGASPASPASTASTAPPAPTKLGHVRLVLGIERASAPQAAWRKYTSNYVTAYLASGQRWTYVRNSLYLVALSMIGQVLSCSMVAYAFARIRWPGRDGLFLVLLATMMLPGQVTMIPAFVIFKHLGLYNTLAALWVPSFLGSAFFIFMLRQFMKSIPTELEEAARIDGCGYAGIYWRIILPVMKPALAAVAIFTFMNTWNDFLGPLIYINDQRLYPLSLGLLDFRTQRGAEYGMLMAASTLMTLPVIAIFFLAQRYFIQGITLTGMKA